MEHYFIKRSTRNVRQVQSRYSARCDGKSKIEGVCKSEFYEIKINKEGIIMELPKLPKIPQTEFHGLISIESEFKSGEGLLGIQTSEDGRIWICINGVAFLRFKPFREETKK